MLVIGGLVLSLLPRPPHISLSPHLVFLVFLPPLVFSGAFNTSWRDFRSNLVSISMLAFGLVGFTVAGVAVLSKWLLPGFDWRMGCALGAVVSTTDTIAAIAIAKRLGLPRRISDLIEGESLINDASGLLALQFAVALVVSGERPTLTKGVAEMIGLIAGGIVVGLVSARIIYLLQRRIDDPPVEITVTLTAPYLAYLTAETFHCSGVLATVVCGLYLGRKRSEILERLRAPGYLGGLEHPRFRAQRGALHPDWLAAAIHSRWDSGIEPAGDVSRRGHLQRHGDRAAPDLDVPGGVDLLLDTNPVLGIEGEASPLKGSLSAGLDGHARSSGAGRRDLSAGDTWITASRSRNATSCCS